MSLLPSLLTSLIIILLIWLLAAFQPSSEMLQRYSTADFFNHTKVIANEAPLTIKAIKKEAPIASPKTITALNNKQQAHAMNKTIRLKGVTASSYFNNVQISGVTQHISLNQLPTLWQGFNENKRLQNNLKKNPSKIFVYYRKFSSSYESALVSIAFDAKVMKSAIHKINLPTTAFSQLLNKGQYNNAQLKKAWDNIDYQRNVLAVLEVHYLNSNSAINNSEIFISYQQGE